MGKKLYIKTFGCQMNVYDSGRMADVLAPLGYEACETPAEADFVILNTCHIREKATAKLFSELGRLRLIQKEKERKGERLILGVAGCVAQAEGIEIQRRAPYVDLVFGPQTYHLLPEMLERLPQPSRGIINTDFPTEPKFDFLPQQTASGVSAFLSIQEGCDKFCTYCVVPYTRGSEYSRAPEKIIAEAETLVQKGAREITLLGQNVNAFHGQDINGRTWSLGKILHRLAEIPRLKRLRYTTSHPSDMDDELLAAHRDIPSLMPFLHLPVQSGSDRILKAMNRDYRADDYRRLIDKLRQIRPDMAVSSDFIVGFPGEAASDFEQTMRLIRDIGFAQAFSFKYSRRAGTPAAALPSQISEKVKTERLLELQKLLRAQQTAFNEQMVGRTVSILIDDKNEHKNRFFGRSPYMQSTFIDASDQDLLCQEITVKITKAGANSLKGKLLPVT